MRISSAVFQSLLNTPATRHVLYRFRSISGRRFATIPQLTPGELRHPVVADVIAPSPPPPHTHTCSGYVYSLCRSSRHLRRRRAISSVQRFFVTSRPFFGIEVSQSRLKSPAVSSDSFSAFFLPSMPRGISVVGSVSRSSCVVNLSTSNFFRFHRGAGEGFRCGLFLARHTEDDVLAV